MKRKDAIALLMMIKNAWDRFEIPQGEMELDAKINLWYRMFKHVSFKDAEEATDSIIKTSKYAPSIAELLEQVRKIHYPEQMTEQEAVNLLIKSPKSLK